MAAVSTLWCSIILLAIDCFVWLFFVEAAEETAMQKLVPFGQQGFAVVPRPVDRLRGS